MPVLRIAGIKGGHKPATSLAIHRANQCALRCFRRDEIDGDDAGLAVAEARLPYLPGSPLRRPHQHERVMLASGKSTVLETERCGAP